MEGSQQGGECEYVPAVTVPSNVYIDHTDRSIK
jgi:hypothetical protein